jgi:hypothetical protein
MQSQVFRFLKMLKEKGKKLFLLTNSPFYFVDGGMRYLLEVLFLNLNLLVCFVHIVEHPKARFLTRTNFYLVYEIHICFLI